jgi:hypothetical protein
VAEEGGRGGGQSRAEEGDGGVPLPQTPRDAGVWRGGREGGEGSRERRKRVKKRKGGDLLSLRCQGSKKYECFMYTSENPYYIFRGHCTVMFDVIFGFDLYVLLTSSGLHDKFGFFIGHEIGLELVCATILGAVGAEQRTSRVRIRAPWGPWTGPEPLNFMFLFFKPST